MRKSLKDDKYGEEVDRFKSGELQLSDILKSYQLSAAIANCWNISIKREKRGLKGMYDWIEKNGETESPDLIAFRADYKQWIVFMRLERLQELLTKSKVM